MNLLCQSKCVSLQNYVTCALGIHYVGFVMMCFGASNSICSFLFGRLARYTGRVALFFFGKVSFVDIKMHVMTF